MRAQNDGRKRVLAIASAGGHWVQLLRLLPAFEGSDVAFATVYPAYRDDIPGKRFYSFDNFSRFHKSRIPRVFVQLLRILLRERPDVVITTGAAPGLLAIVLSKLLFGSKTIWIDSIANCEQLSSSGNGARRFADLWLTQWPHLAGKNGPVFWGAVL
jgi:UDP-N-acetylglucosamine:LPS N-acetylglucosamine transferase